MKWLQRVLDLPSRILDWISPPPPKGWMFDELPDRSLQRQMQILNTAWTRYLSQLARPFRRLK